MLQDGKILMTTQVEAVSAYGCDCEVTQPAAPGWEPRSDQPAVAVIPISSLRPADSPRLAGENGEHVRLMAESSAAFPPVLVHRPTMRVIDGMHRLRAAKLRGHDTIEVQFLEGDEEDIFVIAVQANVAHGLPLSLAERKAAAERIVGSHPQWSDRLIASATGLSHKTVSAVRRRASGGNPQLHARTGHDGRIRPLSSAEGRRMAAEMIRSGLAVSLRQIAKEAGISTGTVRDVQARLMDGQDPVPTQRRRPVPREAPAAASGAGRRDGKPARPEAATDVMAILKRLRNDPALRFREAGRVIVRCLHACTAGINEVGQLIEQVPAHQKTAIASLARANAERWRDLAQRLERR
jgi:ParB-like chromosome segregation protein Spo0J